MIHIGVLGPGCANCKRLEQIAREAVWDACRVRPRSRAG